jgi:hypothetical protein
MDELEEYSTNLLDREARELAARNLATPQGAPEADSSEEDQDRKIAQGEADGVQVHVHSNEDREVSNGGCDADNDHDAGHDGGDESE